MRIRAQFKHLGYYNKKPGNNIGRLIDAAECFSHVIIGLRYYYNNCCKITFDAINEMYAFYS